MMELVYSVLRTRPSGVLLMDSPFPPRCADRFEAKKLLASGSFGSVFLARQRSLDRHAAVKLLHIDPKANQTAATRFLREAQIAAHLRHPNIVDILDHDVEDDVPWIAYEYLPGGSVDRLLRDMGPMRWPDAVNLAHQVALALACAHQQGILHRDVKPGNVLVAGPGRYKLADFGIARQLDATILTVQGALVGTLAYVAPEQIRGGEAVPASDVYSLGVMLFELITGQRVYADATPANILAKHLNEDARPPSSLDPSIPAEVDAAVLKALAKQVGDRYRTADAFADALSALMAQASGTAPAPAPRPSRRSAIAPRDATESVELTPRKIGVPAPSALDATPALDRPRGRGGVFALAVSMFVVGLFVSWGLLREDTVRPVPPPTPSPSPTPSPTPPPDPPPGMVRVAAGSFRMGQNDPGQDWHPAHDVSLGEFWIDRAEVSNAQYAAFCAATGHRPRHGLGERNKEFDLPEHPAVGVSWDDVQAYAKWAHKRLPTEAEWERAARGTDGRFYPWGNEVPSGGRVLNTGMDGFLTDTADKFPYTSPVLEFSRGASPCGALNMAGNVAEWCADRFDSRYYAISPKDDPRGPDTGGERVVRGGHWHDPLESARTFHRHGRPPEHAGFEVGFRCAWDPKLAR